MHFSIASQSPLLDEQSAKLHKAKRKKANVILVQCTRLCRNFPETPHGCDGIDCLGWRDATGLPGNAVMQQILIDHRIRPLPTH